MVIKLLCLSIWMSIPIGAMEEGKQALSTTQTKVKSPKLYTDIEAHIASIREQAYKDGLTVGRQEGQEQIQAFQKEQQELFSLVTSKTGINTKLTNDLQQARLRHEMLQADIRTMGAQFEALVMLNKSFRENPADQIAKLQDLITNLKKLVS